MSAFINLDFVGTRKTDVSEFTPNGGPRVPDDPIVTEGIIGSVADQLDHVVNVRVGLVAA